MGCRTPVPVHGHDAPSAPHGVTVPVTTRAPPSARSVVPPSATDQPANLLAPISSALAAATLAATQVGKAATGKDVPGLDLPTVPGVAHLSRPIGTVGKRAMIRANKFIAAVAYNDLFQYEVSINPESTSRQTNREIFNELMKFYGKKSLGTKLVAYDGCKTLYSACSLLFESREFVVTLLDPDKQEAKEYKVRIQISGRTNMYHYLKFLCGRLKGKAQIDAVLRESLAWNVSRSLYSTFFGHREDSCEGLGCLRGYQQSLLPTQTCLSLDRVIKFVEFLSIRDESLPLLMPARVLSYPLLKCDGSCREMARAPNVEQNKKLINGGVVNNWTCLNFSRVRPQEVHRFCLDMIHMCNATGMAVNANPSLEIKSSSPGNIENAIRDLRRRVKQMHEKLEMGNPLLLIVILPEDSAYYGEIKNHCKNDPGIVSQFCVSQLARKPNNQYLENVATKIYRKVRRASILDEKIYHHNEVNMSSCASQGTSESTDYNILSDENHLIDEYDGLDAPICKTLRDIFSSGPCVGASNDSHPVLGNENSAEKRKWFFGTGVHYSDNNHLTDQDVHAYFGAFTKRATRLEGTPKRTASLANLLSTEVRVGSDKIRVCMPKSKIVSELMQFALGLKNMRLKDMIFLLHGKHLDGKRLLHSVLMFPDSFVHAIPRIRGGSAVEILMQFEKLGDFLQKNNHRLHCKMVNIPQDYCQYDPSNPLASSSILFLSEFSQYIIHKLLVCVCRVGHQIRDVCWNGRFGLDSFLISNGQIIIDPSLPTDPFSPSGARADYNQLHHLITTYFSNLPNEKPAILSHLLELLLICDVRLMRKPDFVTFITNHPCLLSFADRGKLYDLVDHMIRKLTKTYKNTLKGIFMQTGFSGWETTVGGVPGFQRTYMFRAKVDPVTNAKTSLYGPTLDQCFHFGRNFLNHTRRWMSLEVADAALTKLFEKVLPLVLLMIIKDFTGPIGWNIADVIKNSNGDKSTAI